ncbi:neuropeptide Y receptor type 1 [Trichonephila clavipes]|nr:neuropeptide Y receptor type 1 [Trichonephila clavipes]
MPSFMFPVNGTELNFNFTFNFSFAQALDVLEEHFANDKIFGYHTETIIVTCYALLMVMGLFCNLLVCSVILVNTKIRSANYSFRNAAFDYWSGNSSRHISKVTRMAEEPLSAYVVMHLVPNSDPVQMSMLCGDLLTRDCTPYLKVIL